jgi:uncharacterized protein (DUF427 family)
MGRPTPDLPGPGQESVWDYPRPPRLEPAPHHIEVVFNGETVADSRRALRVLETSHPPTYYLPTEDVRMEFLEPCPGSSFCEWKGQASYFDVRVGDRRADKAAWGYPKPDLRYPELADHVAFYCAAMDRCLVDGEKARPQPGGFYGGWISSQVAGPFKGEPGSWAW